MSNLHYVLSRLQKSEKSEIGDQDSAILTQEHPL